MTSTTDTQGIACATCGTQRIPDAKFCANCGTAFEGDAVEAAHEAPEGGSGEAATDLATVCAILGRIWIDHKAEEEFSEFVEYNDIGLPLAYCISEGIVEAGPLAEQYVMETWTNLLETLDLEDSGEWASLEDLLEESVSGMGGA